MNVYHSVKRYAKEGNQPGQMAKWRNDNREAWEIVSEINKLREKYG